MLRDLPALVGTGHIAQEQFDIRLVAEPRALAPRRIRGSALLHRDRVFLGRPIR